jgi:murein DD-endopeptidase MepM/ murein hydrolase activator NlpD
VVQIPLPSRIRGVIPLRGLQLVCCAAVAALGLHASITLYRHSEPARVAVNAFEAASVAEPTQGALEAASNSLVDAVQVVVQRNDTLDQIFRRLEFSLTDLADIRALDAARQALDRIRPGDLLTFFKRGEQLIGLQRPLSMSQTLKVQRDAADNFVASVEEVPLKRHLVTAEGRIDSSLFAAGSTAGLRDATIMELAEIFRWDVDFVLDLRAGDSFTLVYEQIEKEGQLVGDGNILAAEFINGGRSFRAIRYVNAEGKADFYTPEGASLRKAFLKAPVQFSRISSVFNPRRKHPVLNTIRAHRGIDYAAPRGTPIRSAGAGRVQFRGVKGGFGNVVEVAHSGGVVTRYGHMSRFANGLTRGQKIDQGQIIGYVGSTGLATGPHLHFEYIERGVYLDPQKAMRRAEPGAPIPANERAIFGLRAAPLLARLDTGPVPAPSADKALAAR